MSDDRVINLEITAIQIPPDRQRKEVGSLDDLIESYHEVGQINPITITDNPDKAETGVPYILLAGERRLRACEEMGIQVKAIHWDDLSDYQRELVEFHENVRRKNLTWHEEDAALARVLSKYQEIEGGSLRGLAKEMEISPGGISDRIAFAEAVEVLPMLKECKSRNEAMKKLRNLVSDKLTTEALKREKERGEVVDDDSGIDGELFENRMHLGQFGVDSLSVQAGTADIVIFDPPFGIELQVQKQRDYSADASQRSEGIYSDSRDEYVSSLPGWIEEIYRLMSKNSHLWIFFGIEHYEFILDCLSGASRCSWWMSLGQEEKAKVEKPPGFRFDKIPYIWYKKDATGQTNNPNFYGGRAYETFIFAWKGTQPLARRGMPNVIEAPPVPTSDKIHETEKPLLLLDNILRRSYWPGASIMDPTYGSGSTFRAALTLGTTKFFGWELSKEKRDRALLKAMSYTRTLLSTPGFSIVRHDERREAEEAGLEVGQIVHVNWPSESFDVEVTNPKTEFGGWSGICLGGMFEGQEMNFAFDHIAR